jgi:hypothetical protein
VVQGYCSVLVSSIIADLGVNHLATRRSRRPTLNKHKQRSMRELAAGPDEKTVSVPNAADNAVDTRDKDDILESPSEISSLHPSTSIRDNVSLPDDSVRAFEAEKNPSSATATNAEPHGSADRIHERDEAGDSVTSDEIYSGSEDDGGNEDEPALKYEKLGGAAQELLAKDTASALNVSLRLMASTQHWSCVSSD